MVGRILVSIVVAVAGLTVLSGPAYAAVHVGETPDQSWRVNGRVYAMEIVGNLVFVGGSFSAAVNPAGGTVPRNNMAAFRLSDGGLVTGWRADTTSTVRALESDGTSLWIGGRFARVSNVNRPRLAKVDVADGDVDTGFNARLGGGQVRAIHLGEGDDLFVGGSFRTAAGVDRARLAKVDQDSGALVPAFDANVDANVLGLARAGSRLYASGAFRNIGGAIRNGVAGLSTTTGNVSGPAFEDSIRPSRGVDVDDTGTRVFGAGSGNAANNSAQGWNATTGAELWRHNAMGDIQAIKYFNDTVYFGFHEGFRRDLTVRLLAAHPITGALDDDFRPTFNRFIGILALDATSAGLVGGGAFTNVNGVPAEGWVRWLSDGPTPPPPPPPPPPADTVDLVDASTSWRFLDEGIRPAGWENVGFDDSTWDSGLPELGYGDGDENTVVSFGPAENQKYITTYFRTTFTAPDEDATSLEISLLADDGAAVYLNGEEVVRDNLPGGPLTQDTRTPTARAGGAERTFRDFSIPLDALNPGSNTIAAEVHQRGPNSSDISFDLRLVGGFETS